MPRKGVYMAKVIRKLIEYNGIENEFDKLRIFNQDNYEFIFYINDDQPECESVEKIWITYSIEYTEKFKTHKGVSLEGVKLTGNLLLILGDFNVKIQYIGPVINNNVYTVERKIPFSGYINLPEDTRGDECFIPSIVIEDINSVLINKRSIYNNITLSFLVTIY